MTRARDTADTQDNIGGAVPPFAAGKNKIINGDFGIWQRGTSVTNPASGVYLADRFFFAYDGTGTTRTISQQAFTPGTAPVAGYEGSFFWRLNESVAGTGGTFKLLAQKIEDVRTFAGQTVTVSWWAKASVAGGAQRIAITQNFGSGGSGGVTIFAPTFTLTTSWLRYTSTITLASISGKTIGTSSNISLDINLPLNAIQTVDIWGVQIEAGSVATPFQTATGTLQGELAACQRYYYRNTQASNFTLLPYTASATSTTVVRYEVKLPQTMRGNVSSIDYAQFQASDGVTALTVSALTLASASTETVTMTAAVTGATQYRPYSANVTVSGPGHIGYNAEL
jgi:hypothetical protein